MPPTTMSAPQARPSADEPAVVERWITVPGEAGHVRVRLVRPPYPRGTLPAIVYLHGGDWRPEHRGGHDHLVRKLAVHADAAVLFVEYDPHAVGRRAAVLQGYATARWITRDGPALDIDPDRVAVAGDAIADDLAQLAAERGDVRFVHRCPVGALLDPGTPSSVVDEAVDRVRTVLHSSPGHRPRLHEIRVSVVSPEEAQYGTAELWSGGRMVGFTRFEDGDLVVRFEPGTDGDAMAFGARGLAVALDEACRLLARS